MPRQQGNKKKWQIPRIEGKECIWSTHGTKEGDAGAEAHSSRNNAELPSLVGNSGGVRERVESGQRGEKVVG